MHAYITVCKLNHTKLATCCKSWLYYREAQTIHAMRKAIFEFCTIQICIPHPPPTL